MGRESISWLCVGFEKRWRLSVAGTWTKVESVMARWRQKGGWWRESWGETWLGNCEWGWLQRQQSPEPKPQDEEKMLLTDAGDEVEMMAGSDQGSHFSHQSTCYLTSASKGGLQSRNPKLCNGIKLEKFHSQFYLARSQWIMHFFRSRKGENSWQGIIYHRLQSNRTFCIKLTLWLMQFLKHFHINYRRSCKLWGENITY